MKCVSSKIFWCLLGGTKTKAYLPEDAWLQDKTRSGVRNFKLSWQVIVYPQEISDHVFWIGSRFPFSPSLCGHCEFFGVHSRGRMWPKDRKGYAAVCANKWPFGKHTDTVLDSVVNPLHNRSFPNCFYPLARWGSLDFMRVTSLFPSFPPSFLLPCPNSKLQIWVGTAGPQPDDRENVW